MAAQRVDYITRQGAYSPAEARIRHQGLQRGTELEREDLVYWRSRNLPGWAQEDPVRFFHAAEQYTSPHQTAYEEWKISLPRELTRRQQMAAAHDFLQASFGDTHPYVWAFHCPRAADGGEQPHVHVIWSARTLDAHARSPEQFFTRYNRAHPERGGAEKARAFSHFGSVKAFRTMYTDVMNAHLEAAGHVARLHPDRLSDRGFERTPEPRLTPSDSNALKYEGRITDRMHDVLLHRQARQQHMPAERVQARAYWEERKAELGITRDMPLVAQLTHIAQAREQAVRHAPTRPTLAQLREQEQTLERGIRGLEHHVQDLQQYARREQRIEQRRERREWKEELAAERVLAAGKAHGLPRDRHAEQMVARLERTARTAHVTQRLRDLAHTLRQDEPQLGAALRITLFDREEERAREQDRGMGW
jgi:MobA/MobL family